MARVFIAILTLILSSALMPARAQDVFGGKLSLERLGSIQPGLYLAGDNVRFTLTGNGDTFLLRFDNNPEVFVLYAGHASLGGRVLKYDSGETALQVAGWGGITLYTDAAPTGLPAVRTGDGTAPAPSAVSLTDIQNAAEDETQHLAYMRGLRLTVTADWAAISADGTARAFAFDTMENAVRGLDRFSYGAAGREILAHRVDTLMVEPAAKPTLRLKTRTLIVTFNPAHGFAGRASSRAIARALESIFSRH
ncbi:MAG: DUF4908 domain-containing protein [Proteobacteria bacterium]|nr:DUF4908 domain-containing protein [Pseudomonadota bacterium]